jgi:integrase/recombinase XerD
MILCMAELGLRGIETVQMRLGELDWTQMRVTVPPVKNARRGRELPLPPHVASALRDYIEHGRPPSGSDRVFLRHRTFVGQPISAQSARHALRVACRRCHLPEELAGTHKLRHTFASRLYARGATLKQIADLLGHQLVESATIYTHTDMRGLRRLALPWPSPP